MDIQKYLCKNETVILVDGKPETSEKVILTNTRIIYIKYDEIKISRAYSSLYSLELYNEKNDKTYDVDKSRTIKMKIIKKEVCNEDGEKVPVYRYIKLKNFSKTSELAKEIQTRRNISMDLVFDFEKFSKEKNVLLTDTSKISKETVILTDTEIITFEEDLITQQNIITFEALYTEIDGLIYYSEKKEILDYNLADSVKIKNGSDSRYIYDLPNIKDFIAELEKRCINKKDITKTSKLARSMESGGCGCLMLIIFGIICMASQNIFVFIAAVLLYLFFQMFLPDFIEKRHRAKTENEKKTRENTDTRENSDFYV